MTLSPHQPATTVLAQLRADLEDDAFVRRVSEVFLDELPQRVGAIVRAGAPSASASLREDGALQAHTLRGSCALLGAVELMDIAGELERALRSGLDPAVAHLDEIKAIAARTGAEVRHAAHLLEP